jgi:hypothetical protein
MKSNLILLKVGLIFLFFFFFSDLFAYKLKCNSDQTVCDIETKRLVKGDAIGVFDEDDYLLATGHVVAIKSGIVREIKLTKKYSQFSENARVVRIEDDEIASPEKKYKIRRLIQERGYVTQVGLMSIGAGEGLFGIEFDGSLFWHWRGNQNFGFRGIFGMASGKASDVAKEITEYDVSTKAFGASAAYMVQLINIEQIELRSQFDIGVVNSTITVSSPDVSPKVLLDGKLFPGVGALIGGNVSAVTKVKAVDLSAAAQVWSLQNSISYAVLVGIAGGF